jgi:F-type H+-transporting ATPase subunit b
MNPSWRDFAAIATNIVGFLLVVWILRRWAWGPILGFLEERRRRIADEFGAIDRGKAEAQKLHAEFTEKLKEIDAIRRARIQEGVAEAQKLAESIKGEARRDAREIRERAQDDARREYEKARALLRDDIVELTMRSTEKLVREKLDDAKNRELVARYVDDLSKG